MIPCCRRAAAGSFGRCAEAFALQLFCADLAVPPAGLRLHFVVQEEGPVRLSVQLRLSSGRSLPLTGVLNPKWLKALVCPVHPRCSVRMVLRQCSVCTCRCALQ